MDTVVIKTLEGLHCTKLILLFKDNEMIVNKMESLKSCNRCKNETNQVNFCVLMIKEFKKFPIENNTHRAVTTYFSISFNVRYLMGTSSRGWKGDIY